MATDSLGGLVDAARQIAGRRRQLMEQLRDALQRKDTRRALELAEELCGVTHDEARD